MLPVGEILRRAGAEKLREIYRSGLTRLGMLPSVQLQGVVDACCWPLFHTVAETVDAPDVFGYALECLSA